MVQYKSRKAERDCFNFVPFAETTAEVRPIIHKCLVVNHFENRMSGTFKKW